MLDILGLDVDIADDAGTLKVSTAKEIDMKNADMPAMPIVLGAGEVWDEENDYANGLTKREMMAMHICSGNMAARTVSWADVNVELMAMIAVQMTDALLAELEKQQ